MVPPSPGFNIHPGILKTRDDLLRRGRKNYFDSLVSNSGVISDPISDADTARRVNFLHGCTKEVPMRNNFLSNRHKQRYHVFKKWFAANNHPTRQQVEEFVKELNSLECRKGRKALDVNNVIYWFKNTRAAVKRAEMKSKQNPSIPQPTSIHPPVSSSSSSSNNNFLELRSNSPSTQSSMHWPWLSSLKNNNDNYSLPSNFATEKLSSCEVHTPQKESIIMEAESSTKESSINDDRRSEDEDEEGEDIESKQRDSSSKSELTSELLSPSLKEDDSLSYRPSSLIYPPPPAPSTLQSCII
ncbi:unnamed protein product [Lepeophtheirus salmonis]|uniref:(salmon louse) hypothetical protein n=1 Tax=Lepeophtheirus salmonis TaxID=72036 RepID=A0A7R8D512_LEPSM|nr:unnamed protein product [Lepeophtheirus salmonis]CAF3001631.1 unnamed protein product [Lepeophtheirus salmonis]